MWEAVIEQLSGQLGNIITTGGVVLVAILQIRANRDQKAEAKKNELRAQQQKLSIDLAYATTKLCTAIAMKVTEEHADVDFDRELKEVNKVIEKYDDLMRKMVAEST